MARLGLLLLGCVFGLGVVGCSDGGDAGGGEGDVADDAALRRVVPLEAGVPMSRLAPVLVREFGDEILPHEGSMAFTLEVREDVSHRVTLSFTGVEPRLLAGPAGDGALRALTPVAAREGWVEATLQPDHDAARLVLRGADGAATLGRLEVRPWASESDALIAAEDGRLAQVEVRREHRPGWRLAPGASQDLELRFPADGSRLVLAVAPDPVGVGEASALAVSWREDGAEPRLLRRVPVGATPVRWRELDVDLASLVGRSGTLTLANEGPGLLAAAVPEVFCEGGARRPNLVLLSLDTTRPDRLGAYGYERDTTPTLAALAERGVLCEDVLSVSSYTLPAHATVFSGMHPLGHGLVHPGHALDTERVPLLAQLLRERGYATRAFTGGGYLSADYGFHHGFGSYGVHDPARPVTRGEREWLFQDEQRAAEFASRQSTLGWSAALDWIDTRSDVPFFLFLQTYAIHDYRPGEERAAFDAPAEGEGVRALRTLLRQRDEPYTSQDLEQLGDLYDGAIRRVDGLVGELMTRLESAGVADDTIVVVLSDHGETLGEHGLQGVPMVGHGFELFDEQVRVPLLMVAPGLAPRRVTERLSLLDVAPTLLELLGVPAPDSVQGRSLLPLFRGEADSPAPSPVLLDLDTPVARGRALYHGDAKLLVGDPEAWVSHPVPQAVRLYDRRADPGETHDLSAERPDDVARLREHMDALVALYTSTGAGPAHAELSEETLRALAELGYLER
jgi:arylsulfatase A-like enzyme